jgi:hypothetical protein
VDKLRKEGIRATRTESTPAPYLFQRMRDMPEIAPNVLLMHCGMERSEYPLSDDPAVIARRVADMPVKLSVGVYNPHFYDVPTGNYDLLVCNPASRKKN